MIQVYYPKRTNRPRYFSENVPKMCETALVLAFHKPKDIGCFVDESTIELTKTIRKLFLRVYRKRKEKFIEEFGRFDFYESFNISADAYRKTVSIQYDNHTIESFESYLFSACLYEHDAYLKKHAKNKKGKKPLRDTYQSHVDGIDEVEAADQISSWANDDTDRIIMTMLLQSHTHKEISEALDVSTKEIQRRLAGIRAANGID